MQPFRVHILGCGSALPTFRHSTSSQLVEIRGKYFMVDCGEGTQTQLRKSHVNFNKISAILISHLHGDHCFGLLGLLSTLAMLGRTSRLKLFAPMEYKELFEQERKFFLSTLEYEVEFIGVDTTKHTIVYDDHSLTIESIPLQHRMPCCGYLFREKPTLPHIRRDMIDCYEIPVSQINNIKNGADWTTPDGDLIKNERLVLPADPPRSYAYCSDTRYIPSLHKLVKGVDLLYHESTYAQDYEDRARLYHHSTARQAAMVAKDAEAAKLLLGHYSSRYPDEQILLNEAKEIFPNVCLTDEGLVFDVLKGKSAK